MKWDYMAVTIEGSDDGRAALGAEVERRRVEGWRLADVQPAALDGDGVDGEDGEAAVDYVCIFRRVTAVESDPSSAIRRPEPVTRSRIAVARRALVSFLT
jgi:hypothetical protein